MDNIIYLSTSENIKGMARSIKHDALDTEWTTLFTYLLTKLTLQLV